MSGIFPGFKKKSIKLFGGVLQTSVKKWFRDKDTGFLDNRGGPDIMVSKGDLVDCQFLKVGAIVEFECHPGEKGLVAKKVKLVSRNRSAGDAKKKKEFRFGVMT